MVPFVENRVVAVSAVEEAYGNCDADVDVAVKYAAVGVVVAMGLFAGVGAGIGALVGMVAGGSVSDAVFVGAMIGLGTVMAWLLLTLVVVAVLWIRAISPRRRRAGGGRAGGMPGLTAGGGVGSRWCRCRWRCSSRS
jgi:hypothetical protein